jgi:hypothetical protein
MCLFFGFSRYFCDSFPGMSLISGLSMLDLVEMLQIGGGFA